jgi:hypothetical protein
MALLEDVLLEERVLLEEYYWKIGAGRLLLEERVLLLGAVLQLEERVPLKEKVLLE